MSIDIDYIHGKADVNACVESSNIVLGIDEYLVDDYQKRYDNEYIEFKKFYQRIYKGTGNTYLRWLDHRRENIERTPKVRPEPLNIYIYGHSLDKTDGDIIARLINEPEAYTTIYYHNREALGKQIANLTAVLGEENLISKTGGKRQSVRFVPIGDK